MFLLITPQQYEILQIINASHASRKISPIKSSHNNWIINDDLLTDCDYPSSTWYDWKDWLRSLSETNETPPIDE